MCNKRCNFNNIWADSCFPSGSGQTLTPLRRSSDGAPMARSSTAARKQPIPSRTATITWSASPTSARGRKTQSLSRVTAGKTALWSANLVRTKQWTICFPRVFFALFMCLIGCASSDSTTIGNKCYRTTRKDLSQVRQTTWRVQVNYGSPSSFSARSNCALWPWDWENRWWFCNLGLCQEQWRV